MMMLQGSPQNVAMLEEKKRKILIIRNVQEQVQDAKSKIGI